MLDPYVFSADDVEYLASLRGADGASLFAAGFLDYLERDEEEGAYRVGVEGRLHEWRRRLMESWEESEK